MIKSYVNEILEQRICAICVVMLTCTTNTMDVVFDIVGHIEVDDDANILNIQPSCCHISGYQHRKATFFELTQNSAPISNKSKSYRWCLLIIVVNHFIYYSSSTLN